MTVQGQDFLTNVSYDEAGRLLTRTLGGFGTPSLATTRSYYPWEATPGDSLGRLQEVQVTNTATPGIASGQTWKYYYYAGAERLAMKVVTSAGTSWYYLLGDHLGSTSVVVDQAGSVSQMLYRPWGETLATTGSIPTDYKFTGQRKEDALSLYFYQARFYDPTIGHFVQADTVVPIASQGVMAWNHYAYVNYNPIKSIDPTGHACMVFDGSRCVVNDDGSYIPQPTPPSPGNPPYLPTPTPTPPEPPLIPDPDHREDDRLDSQCTPTKPCLDPWKQPWWWNTNPKHPDYITLMINAGSLLGGTVAFTLDRYGGVYFGLGGNAGKSLTNWSLSLTGGYIGSPFDTQKPDQGNIDGFLTKLSINASIGALGGGGLTWSPLPADYVDSLAPEVGIILPANVGVSAIWNFKIFDFSMFFH